MASMNKVFLLGNLTRDPELRYTSGGAAICALGLATNRSYTTARGEEREEVCFVDIEVWGKSAEASKNYLRKGAPVMIEGRLRYDQWEDRESGKKRSRLTVTAERVQFLGQPSRGGENFAPPADPTKNVASQPHGPGPTKEPRRADNVEQQSAMPPMPPFESADKSDDDIPF